MHSKTAAPNEDGKLSTESTKDLRDALIAAQKVLGFDGTGHSHGIASDRVYHDMRFCYETHKALAKELAMQRDTNPSFRAVDYDGLMIRVTDEVRIKVNIVETVAKTSTQKTQGLHFVVILAMTLCIDNILLMI
jgi:hypothetical protein